MIFGRNGTRVPLIHPYIFTMKKHLTLYAFLLLLLSGAAYGQQASRLKYAVASDFMGAGVPFTNPEGFFAYDSTIYTYSGTNGGGIRYEEIYRHPVIDLRFDTAYNYGVEFPDDTAVWVAHGKFYFQADSAHIRNIEMQTRDLFTPVYQLSARQRFIYDTAGRLLRWEDGNWNSLASTWQSNNRYNYDYDAAGRELTMISQTSSSGSWNNMKRDSNVYAGGRRTEQYRFAWNGPGSGWVALAHIVYLADAAGKDTCRMVYERLSATDPYRHTGKTVLALDAAGNVISETSMLLKDSVGGAPVYANRNRSLFSYNSDRQVTLFETQNWDSASAAWTWEPGVSFRTRYVYELYNLNPSGIVPAASSRYTLSLYPVPADDVLTIALEWEKTQLFAISIFDAAGRLRSRTTAKASSYTDRIDVSDLVAGVYSVVISTGQEQITRQIVVRH